MWNEKEKLFFLENGYLVVEDILSGNFLKTIQADFDYVWEKEGAPVNQHKLLKYESFRKLIEHPPILDRHRAIFGNQVQLLQFDLLRQGPKSNYPDRHWHRDFIFPGDVPLSINTILFVDDITSDKGPTRVVPGSHRGKQSPPIESIHQPLERELAVEVPAGSAIFINSAIWHSGARNESEGLRRGIYLYYGYWWLKRYDTNQTLPWQVYEQASEQRLQLLGLKMPEKGLHMYEQID